MKKIILVLLVVIAGLLVWTFACKSKKQPDVQAKQQPVSVSSHSAAFNQSVNQVLAAYNSLTESFVNWDSAGVNQNAKAVKSGLEKVNFDELKKDTTIYLTAQSYIDGSKGEADNIRQAADITAKRHAFNNLTGNLYDLLRTIHYDQAPIYRNQCPMAFNDNEPGDWLSRTDAIRNPYLGLHHPKYGKGMIECGNTIDSIHYSAAKQ